MQSLGMPDMTQTLPGQESLGRYVQNKPLLMVGAALAAGYVLGAIEARRSGGVVRQAGGTLGGALRPMSLSDFAGRHTGA